jgi:hypothetical protein
MNLKPPDGLRISQGLEDGSFQHRPEIDLTSRAVPKAQPDQMAADVASLEDVKWLLQWRNPFQGLTLLTELPVLKQFCLMQFHPPSFIALGGNSPWIRPVSISTEISCEPYTA